MATELQGGTRPAALSGTATIFEFGFECSLCNNVHDKHELFQGQADSVFTSCIRVMYFFPLAQHLCFPTKHTATLCIAAGTTFCPIA
eukprot:813508-Pleurochrysis_carterae.AAC.1